MSDSSRALTPTRILKPDGTALARPSAPASSQGTSSGPDPRTQNSWERPRTGADRGPREFEGFEDFHDFGPEEQGLPFGMDGAFGGSSGAPDGSHGGDGGAAGGPMGFDLSRTRIREEVLNLLTRDLVERYRCMPVRVDADGLLLAMVDPNEPALREIAAHTGLPSRAVAAPIAQIAARIAEHYRA
jgi:hypothetical protein